MNEDKFKNNGLTDIEDLDRFINVLANIEKKVNLYALGGTAMILENIKAVTRDIDFITDTNYQEMRKYLTLAGYEEKQQSEICNIWNFDNIRVDFFMMEK
jgi:hypothetical protein